LPLKTVPQFLRTIAVDITAYRLYTRRPRTIQEHIKANYENALKQLTAIKKGDILLETPLENTAMPKVKSSFRTNKTAQDRIFGPEAMRKFRR
jgi:phage gp36-like protein